MIGIPANGPKPPGLVIGKRAALDVVRQQLLGAARSPRSLIARRCR